MPDKNYEIELIIHSSNLHVIRRLAIRQKYLVLFGESKCELLNRKEDYSSNAYQVIAFARDEEHVILS